MVQIVKQKLEEFHGYNLSKILKSKNYGLVNSNSGIVGGIVGQSYSGTIEMTFSIGNVTGMGEYVGGLVGQVLGEGDTILNCYSKSELTSNNTVGGLVGVIDENANDTVITNCYNSQISLLGSKVGLVVGKAGSLNTNISNTYYVTKEGVQPVGELREGVTLYCVGKTLEQLKENEFKDLLGNTIWNVSLDSSINEGLAYLLENVPN